MLSGSRRVAFPEGRSGPWQLRHFTVPQVSAAGSTADSRPAWCRPEPGGSYTELSRGSESFMTDLPDELYTQRRAVEEARARGGSILITGLGLALVVDEILDPQPRSVDAESLDAGSLDAGSVAAWRLPGSSVGYESPIAHVTIVEQSADVVALVAPTVEARYGDRVEIVIGDAFSWRPPAGRRFTVGWHDIWPNPQADGVLAEADSVEAHHAPWCDWQGSWVREWCADIAAHEQAARGGGGA